MGQNIIEGLLATILEQQKQTNEDLKFVVDFADIDSSILEQIKSEADGTRDLINRGPKCGIDGRGRFVGLESMNAFAAELRVT